MDSYPSLKNDSVPIMFNTLPVPMIDWDVLSYHVTLHPISAVSSKVSLPFAQLSICQCILRKYNDIPNRPLVKVPGDRYLHQPMLHQGLT